MRKEIGFDISDVTLILGFGLLPLNFPSFRQLRFISDTQQQSLSILFILVFPLLICWSGLYYLKYLFLAGYPLFLFTVWKNRKTSFLSLLGLLIALITVFVHLTISIIDTNSNVANPLFFEALELGRVHIDTLMHMALANMIDNYGVSSTGVDGLIEMKYHIGSHFYLSKVGHSFGMRPLLSYNLLYVICFPPLFLYLFLEVTSAISRRLYPHLDNKLSWIFWAAFIILSFSIVSDWGAKFGNNRFLFQIASESYAFAFILVSLFVLLFIDTNLPDLIRSDAKFIVLLLVCFLFIFLASICKISVGFILYVSTSYLSLRFLLLQQSYFDRAKCLTLLCICTASFFLTSTYSTNSSGIDIKLFHFPIFFTGGLPQAVYFYLFHFFWGIIYSVLRIMTTKINSIKRLFLDKTLSIIDVELFVLVAFISSLPGILIDIPDGSAIYFSIVGQQLGIILLLSFVLSHTKRIKYALRTHFYIKKNDISLGFLLLLFICSIIFWGIFRKLSTQAFYAAHIHHQTIEEYKNLKGDKEASLITLDSVQMMRTYMSIQLDSISKLYSKEKKKMAINISQSDTLYWSLMNTKSRKQSISLIVPAISGVMQVDGMPPFETNLHAYGFDNYQPRKYRKDTLSYSQMCIKAKMYLPELEKVVIYYPSHNTKSEQICR